MSYTIPIGPYHPALEEPYKIEVTCEGESVREARLSIGFNFRGIEWLAERRNYIQDIALMERVCGICSNVHTLSFCMAVEQLAGLEVPPRAQYIRVVIAELERLHSHILWAGVAAQIMGFQTLFMTCFNLREQIMDVLEAVSGNRVNYAMNCIGGVNRDISDPESILVATRGFEREMTRTLIPVFTGDRTVRARCAGVGLLTREQAISWGAVGPTARASGVPQDMRLASPYAAYDRLEFDVPVEAAGDVLARIVVRALEMVESCRIVEQALQQMPPGPIRGPGPPGPIRGPGPPGPIRGPGFVEVPAGEAVARVEAPRGEVFYYVASDGSDVPLRVKVRTPSFANMPTVRLMVQGASLADVPLIQASIDPCYSCTDR